MKKIFLFLALSALAAVPATAAPSRFEAVMNALNEFELKLTDSYDQFERTPTHLKNDLGDRKTHTISADTEAYYYKYWETIPIEDEGIMYGINLNYTYRPPDSSPMSNHLINTYLLDFRFAAGKVDYTGSGTINDQHNDNYEIRGIVGKEFNYDGNTFMPYLGLGYRYLLNEGNDMQSSTGQWGYDRRSHYHYLPFGLTFTMPKDQWEVSLNAEYDIFIRGTQYSDLNEVTPHANYEYPNTRDKQSKGFGVRSSLRFVYHMPRLNLFAEPFIRFWNIEDSEVTCQTNKIGDVQCGLEPENTTHEIGSKFGIQF